MNGITVKKDSAKLIETFLGAQDVTAQTKETYRRSIRPFFKWIDAEGLDLATATRIDLLKYKAFLSNKKPATQATYIVAVRRLYAWLESEKIYPDIAKTVKAGGQSHGFRKDPLTIEQVKRLLSRIERNTIKGKRDFALINLLIRTGLRTIEVERANVEDIRQSGGEALLYIQGKGRSEKDAFVLLTPESLDPIMDYLRARGPVDDIDPLFEATGNKAGGERLTTRSISRIVKDRMGSADIVSNRLTAHSLRHTAITLSLLGGATIQETQNFARHSNINTTMIYAHNIDRIGNAPERKIAGLLG